MNKKIIMVTIVLVVALGAGATIYKLRSPDAGEVKESFTTYGSCSCPPSESDQPEIISIRNNAEYQRIKAKDAYDKQHCAPNVGCSLGHMITYRYIE